MPTSQVQRALVTWAGKAPRTSRQAALSQARRVVDMLDDFGAPREQRERLVKALAYTASAKRVDKTLLESVREVFDPGREGRTFGSRLCQ